MKKTLFLLCGILMSINMIAQSKLDKRIDFSVDNETVTNALLSICEKANLNISFQSALLSDDQTVSFNYQNQSVKFLLNACLKETEFGYKYEKDRLLLYQKPPPIFTISGFVEDSLSGERLVGATVYDALSGRGATTNEYGFYSLSIPRGKAKLSYAYLGFSSKEYQIQISKNRSYNMALKASVTLEEVVVVDNKIDPQLGLAVEQTPNYSSKILDQLPPIAGVPDVLNYLKTLAGVESAEGGLGGMSIRGGNADQNLVLLDGVPVYNPSHSLGLLSIFSPNIMKNAKIYKGQFPAKYGGRLSSVIDIQTRDGNNKKWSREVGIGLFATNLLIEGPIKKDKTAILIAGRRTHWDPLIKLVSKLSFEEQNRNRKFNYFFYDMNVKINHIFSEKDRLYFSFYNGADAFEDETIFSETLQIGPDEIENEQSDYLRYRWGNNVLSLRWNHLWGDQLFSNTTFTYSQFKFQTFIGQEFYEERPDSSFSSSQLLNFKSDIQEAALKADFDYSPNNKHTIKFGGGIYQRFFTPEVLAETSISSTNIDFGNGEIDDLFPDDNTLFASEINVYGQDDIKLSDKWKLQVGLNISTFIAPNKVYWSNQPRLFIQNRINDKGTFYASISKMTQFLHVLQSFGSGIPNDLWVPATKKIAPQNAWQFSAGTDWQLFAGFHWSMEVYYKKLNNLITYEDGTVFTGETGNKEFSWEEKLSVGEGWNHGIETSIKRDIGKATGWINYTYSKANRQFSTFNNGEKFPFRFNRKHSLKVGYKQQFSEKFSIFATWTYGSGNYVTLVKNLGTEDLEALDNDFLNFVITDDTGPVNGHQLSKYDRFDINFSWTKKKKKTERSTSFGFYNFYGNPNPVFAYQLKPSLVEPGGSSIIERGGIGFVPSFRYSIKF